MSEDLQAQIDRAAREITDLVGLAFDERPNSSQVGQFAVEGLEAFQAIGDLMGGLLPEQRRAALAHFAARSVVYALGKIPGFKL